MVWGVRNVLRSGLYELLSEHFRIVLAVPKEATQDILREGVPIENICELTQSCENRKHQWYFQVMRYAYQERHPIPANDVFIAWASKNRQESRISLLRRILDKSARFAGKLLSKSEKSYQWLEREEQRAFRTTIPHFFWEKIRQENPVLGRNAVLPCARAIYER